MKRRTSRDSVSSLNMRVPAVVLLVLGSAHLVCAETNSLSLLVTFIIGETPFPELTGVLMVNDIPVEYGDLKKVVSRRHWRPNDTIQESHLRDFVVAEAYAEMKSASLTMMKHFNHTEGVHVYQAFVACDLEDDKLSRFFITKAYDGDENYQYDMISHTQNTTVPEFMWGKLQKEAAKMVYTNIHQPLCVRTLRRYLREDKNILLRKERPRVRVTQRTEAHSGRTQVSCLATGFYPRCINVTLLRDGRPVPDQELTGGQVLPNGDGTYQLRRSLSVSEEELRQRHLYTCTVSHLSVDNRLDVNIEAEDPPHTVILCAVLGSVLVVLIVVTVTVFRCRTKTGSQNSCETSAGVKYTAAHKSDRSDTSSTSS